MDTTTPCYCPIPKSEYAVHDTYRVHGKGGSGRATYRPDLSQATPWTLFVNGEATVHRADINQAFDYLRSKNLNKFISFASNA